MTRTSKIAFVVSMALAVTLVVVFQASAYLTFSGECDQCHYYGSSGGSWHNAHMAQSCISSCGYCHSGPPLSRSHCNECHEAEGTSYHHDCAGETSDCLSCHSDAPPPEQADVTACLDECEDNLDNDGDCLYDGDDGDCLQEICDDGVDNDLDDLVDCDDPDCLDVIPEDCTDGVDNDCDGLVDASDLDCVCIDQDDDGYGSPASPACPNPQEDCDDLDPEVNPGHEEVPGNGIDDNCNGQVDEGGCFLGVL